MPPTSLVLKPTRHPVIRWGAQRPGCPPRPGDLRGRTTQQQHRRRWALEMRHREPTRGPHRGRWSAPGHGPNPGAADAQRGNGARMGAAATSRGVPHIPQHCGNTGRRHGQSSAAGGVLAGAAVGNAMLMRALASAPTQRLAGVWGQILAVTVTATAMGPGRGTHMVRASGGGNAGGTGGAESRRIHRPRPPPPASHGAQRKEAPGPR